MPPVFAEAPSGFSEEAPSVCPEAAFFRLLEALFFFFF
jgi:hypothetical protein